MPDIDRCSAGLSDQEVLRAYWEDRIGQLPFVNLPRAL
jgi:hypothetical protein